jgi:hypothetical protein
MTVTEGNSLPSRASPRPVYPASRLKGAPKMGHTDRILRVEQNQRLFCVSDGIDGESAPLAFACECARETCLGTIPLTAQQFLAIASSPNWFIVLRGHESRDVEDVVAERDGFLIVSKGGAGARS